MGGRQLTLVGGLAEQMLQTGPRVSWWGKGQTWELHFLELSEIWAIKQNILEMWGTLSFFFFPVYGVNALCLQMFLRGKRLFSAGQEGFQQQQKLEGEQRKNRTLSRLLPTYYTFAAGRSENMNTFPRKNNSFIKKIKVIVASMSSSKSNWWKIRVVRSLQNASITL